jgi:hypothetical protein
MGHRAAVYTVRVKRARKRTDKYRPLGNIDEAGTYIGEVLEGLLTDGFSVSNADESKMVGCDFAELDGQDLKAAMLHGESGFVSDLFDQHGKLKAHQVAPDTQQVRCGVLFRLPPDQDRGWLAVHANNRRSAKGLMQAQLNADLKEHFPDLTLEITPYVDEAALKKAVEDHLSKVRLVRHEPPDDHAVAMTDKWVASDAEARLELAISTPERGRKLLSGLVSQFLKNQKAADFESIVTFEGIQFDEAKVEVELPNGDQRTFNISAPENGHAFTEELGQLDYDDDGDPTPDSVFSALSTILSRVSS